MVCSPATGKKKYFNKVEKTAKEFKNLKFIDFIENKKIPKILYKSKIFILTSEQEGDWPMTVLEASSCGVPVISYKLNYDFLIDKYNGGVFCNDNFNLVEKYFKEIVSDDKKLEELAKNVYRYAKENHDIEINANKFLNIIKKWK